MDNRSENPGVGFLAKEKTGRSVELRNTISAIGISVIAMGLFLLHIFSKETKIDAVGLSLVVLAILPWLLPFLQSYLESGKILGQEFKFLRGQVDEQWEIIHLIYEALRRSLTQFEYNHLEELESTNASNYFSYSDFLRDEMIRLCQHGFASETYEKSTWEMKDKGEEIYDLKEFYQITEDGKEHLKLLRKLHKYVTLKNSADKA